MACIGIDCRFASAHAGLGTYTRNIVSGLAKELVGHHLVLFVSGGSTEWVSSLHGSSTRIQVVAKPYSIREQCELSLRMLKASIDLFFAPHFNVPLYCPAPFVVTIHDLILHRYPNDASVLKRFSYRHIIGSAVRRAHTIIAVSTFTASEISSVYGADAASKTVVITEGVDSSFSRLPEGACHAVLDRYHLRPGFFLYVGSAKQHKNVQMLLDAHGSLQSAPPLVLVCGGSETKKLVPRGNTRLLHDVPVRELPALYSAARCFVTPSFYEGFCLPILEARACGCPVIATNCTAIVEIAGLGATLIEPTITALTAALRDPPTSSEQLENRYTWDRAARETARILLDTFHG